MSNGPASDPASAPDIAPSMVGPLLAQAQGLVGAVQAAMLYGSCARGDATMKSDVDVLAIVRDNPGSFYEGTLAVTAYRAGHLRAMAERGSRFVLHLVCDREIFYDPADGVAGILAADQPPAG